MVDRKTCVVASVVAIGSVVALSGESAQRPATREHWVATWTATLEGAGRGGVVGQPLTVKNQTVRIPLNSIGVGGPRLRLKLSNEYGSKPVVIGAASVVIANTDWTVGSFKGENDGIVRVKANSDWTVKGNTFAKVSFGGASRVTIPPGAQLLSDPVEMKTSPLQDLAVSLYLPEETVMSTVHGDNAGSGTLRPVLTPGAVISTEGDFTTVAALPLAEIARRPLGRSTHIHPPFLSAIEVVAPASTPVVVILGDTWSEGPGLWQSFLRDRLARQGIALIEMSQVAGTLVLDRPGVPGGLARFDRDVLGVAGVTHLFLVIGANDIYMPSPERGNVLPAATIGWALKQAADRAHAAGLKVIGTTVLPFEGSAGGSTPEKRRLRDELNAWMRTSGVFDALVDFDALLRDPQQPARLLPAYDVGNHFTPNTAGSRKLAEAIDVALFTK